MTTRKIAHEIADRLFTNGNGTTADRLVLEKDGAHNFGGWCKQAVIDVIVDELRPIKVRSTHGANNSSD